MFRNAPSLFRNYAIISRAFMVQSHRMPKNKKISGKVQVEKYINNGDESTIPVSCDKNGNVCRV